MSNLRWEMASVGTDLCFLPHERNSINKRSSADGRHYGKFVFKSFL